MPPKRIRSTHATDRNTARFDQVARHGDGGGGARAGQKRHRTLDTPVDARATALTTPTFARGQAVWARWQDKLYYHATITDIASVDWTGTGGAAEDKRPEARRPAH